MNFSQHGVMILRRMQLNFQRARRRWPNNDAVIVASLKIGCPVQTLNPQMHSMCTLYSTCDHILILLLSKTIATLNPSN